MSTETTSIKPTAGKIFAILLFALLLVHVARNIQPCVLYQADEASPAGMDIPMFPLFISGGEQFQESLQSVGGVARYGGDYLSQHFGRFFYSQKLDKLLFASHRPYSFGGTLVLGFLAVMTCLITSRVIPLLGGKPGGILRFVPVVLLMVIWNRYTFVVGEQVALLGVLVGLWCVLSIPRDKRLSMIVPLVAIPVLYYLVGGMAMLFALVVGLHELCVRRRMVVGVAQLVVGAATPVVLGALLMKMSVADAYLVLSGFGHGGVLAQVAWGVMVLFFVVLGIVLGGSEASDDADNQATSSLTPARARLVCLVMLLLMVGLAFFALDGRARAFRQTCFHYQNGEWAMTVISARDYVDRGGKFPSGLTRRVNRALHERRLLTREMFRYPQSPLGGLLMGPNPLEEPFDDDTMLQLGLVDMSRLLAVGSVEKWGPRPVTCRLLVTIGLVDENYVAVEEYLSILADDMIHKRVNRKRLDAILAGESFGDPEQLRRIRSLRSPLVMRNNMGTPMVLQALARQNPRDRMAFEYLMAQYLLGGELNRFAEDLSRIGQYDYESLPGHYMEAMTLYNLLEGESLTVPGLKPDPGTSERCQRFSALYREYNGDPEAMLAATNREMTGTYFSYYYALMTSGKLLAEEQAPVDVE